MIAQLYQRATLLRAATRTIQLSWNAGPAWTIMWWGLLVVQGLLPAVMITLTRDVVDRLAAAVTTPGDWTRFQPVFIPAALLAGILVLIELFQNVGEWARVAQSEQIRDVISKLIHQQSVAVDLAFYESPESYDQLYRAREDAPERSLALLDNLGALLQNTITLLAIGVVLVPYGVWLPVVLLLGAIPGLLMVLRFDRHYHQWWLQTTAERRRAQYYDEVLTDAPNAAEIRLFNLGTHFQAAHNTLRDQLRAKRLGLLRRQILVRLIGGVIAFITLGSILAWMLWRLSMGLITLGDLVLFYQTVERSQSLLRATLADISQLYNNSVFLSHLFAFLDLKPRVADPSNAVPMPNHIHHSIRFRDVTFCYPLSERTTLERFNLVLPAGKIVAIVGPNGSGKSTLLKLLCRFYDPEKGSIEIDGYDLRRFRLSELRQRISVLFQVPVSYHETAQENISMGDRSLRSDTHAIQKAAISAGAHDIIARLPQGYATLLGKWFAEGTELSEGEWQRIALARAFLRESPIVLLDEPTSFMDSWSEAEWLDRLRPLLLGRTAVIITHRFTTAMRADVIHVMRYGKIVESGSHTELLLKEGLYAESWRAQTQIVPEAENIHAQEHAA